MEASAASEVGMERVQLLESSDYQLRLTGMSAAATVTTSHPDVISLDYMASDEERFGRLRTGLRTGLLEVRFYSDGDLVGVASMEVRSRKLDYLSQYRWMLRDIASESIGLLLQDFAASSQRLASDPSVDPVSAYQRLRLLRSLIEDPTLIGAIESIFASPHSEWEASEEPGRFRGRISPSIVRQLAMSTPRTPWPNSPIEGWESVPARVVREVSVETLDTVPNRFVKYVLDRWSALAAEVQAASTHFTDQAARERARIETEEFRGRLDRFRDHPMLAEVSELESFPANNQVVMRRTGYREVLAAYAMVEAGASIDWAMPEAAFSAGQRNVAKLYEFWVYIWLRHAIRTLCETFDDRPLARNSGVEGGLASARRGIVRRMNQSLEVTLYYNRSFAGGGTEGWSGAGMRPDFSVEVSVPHGWSRERPLWLHFDAKYRVQAASQIFVDQADPALDAAKREDILKMHAYRDAIRQSGGAYVIFPGQVGHVIRPEFEEMLPGLGAFALVPNLDGVPMGLKSIEAFLDEAFAHYGSSVTRDRRARYWDEVVQSGPGSAEPAVIQGLPRPPADVPVLLGYVKGPSQYRWILEQGLYNIRGGQARGAVGLAGPELACRFVVIYGDGVEPQIWSVEGSPEIWTRQRMRDSGYPRPTREVYLCYPLGALTDFGLRLNRGLVRQEARLRAVQAGHDPGHPVVVTALDLLTLTDPT